MHIATSRSHPPGRARARAAAWALAGLAALTGCGTSPGPAGAPPPGGPDTRQEADALRATPLDAQRVARATFGADAAALQRVARLGWARWIDEQLHPPPWTPPAAVADRLAQMRIVREPLATRLRADVALKKQADGVADDARRQAAQQAYQRDLDAQADEAAQRWLLLAVNSPAQLRERMVWFWVNHFSIGQRKANLRLFAGDYEQALRAHALGRFRDLLEASALHPAMLRYLDNERNAAGKLNENYARELMELHTLGVDAGYTQADVQELARVLTGLGVRADADDARLRPSLQAQYVHVGAFEFNPARHDAGDKRVLGQPVRPAGLAEVRQVLDRLARDPATARHVSAQIARYFIGDAPPPLVEHMARRWQASDGDIAQVLQVLLASPDYDATLGRHFKDPWQYVLSAARLAYDGRTIVDAAPLLGALRTLGEPPFGRETPDGFPLVEAAWASPGQLTARFDVARGLVGGNGRGNGALLRVAGQPAPMAPVPARVEGAAWLRTQAPRASAATRDALRETLQSHPGDWSWVAIVSPEFMHD